MIVEKSPENVAPQDIVSSVVLRKIVADKFPELWIAVVVHADKHSGFAFSCLGFFSGTLSFEILETSGEEFSVGQKFVRKRYLFAVELFEEISNGLLFQCFVKKVIGNENFVIGRDAQKVFVVGFVKQRVHAKSVGRIGAVGDIVRPARNVARVQKRGNGEMGNATSIVVGGENGFAEK